MAQETDRGVASRETPIRSTRFSGSPNWRPNRSQFAAQLGGNLVESQRWISLTFTGIS